MTDTPEPAYVPAPLRIAASYPEARVGDVATPGVPDSVEIEIGDVPEGGPAELAAFITTLVGALFRDGATDMEVIYNKPESTPSAVAEVERQARLARGGRAL